MDMAMHFLAAFTGPDPQVFAGTGTSFLHIGGPLLQISANTQYVLIGALLLGAAAGITGTFTLLRKRALVGDAIAHAILPGICLAFILSGNKNPFVLLAGATVTGWLSLLAIDAITRLSKLKPDTAISLVLSVFFGIGILLLTAIQRSGNAAQAGLDSFLFGQAASMTPDDILKFGGVALLLVIVVFVFFREFRLISFDPDYAAAIGMPVRFLEFLLATVTVLAVAVGIQAVGIVLMAALLITPAAAARFWTNRLGLMMALAAIFGSVSGLTGAWFSSLKAGLPTGPLIVLVLSAIALISIMLAPEKGVLARAQRRRQNRRKILLENILKAFYHLGEKDQGFQAARTPTDLISARAFLPTELRRGLNKLESKHLVIHDGDFWKLSKAGLEEGKRITRLHRLWELYLTQRLRFQADHVHHDAEVIEHIITPELEAELMKELGTPEIDPHDSKIPWPGEALPGKQTPTSHT